MLNKKEQDSIYILQNLFIQNEYIEKSQEDRFKILIEYIVKNKIELNYNIYSHLKYKTDFKEESKDLKELLKMFIFDNNFIE